MNGIRIVDVDFERLSRSFIVLKNKIPGRFCYEGCGAMKKKKKEKEKEMKKENEKEKKLIIS